MRLLLIALIVTFAAAVPWRGAQAAGLAHDAPAPAVSAQEEGAGPENEDTVEVQLVVLGVVLSGVFVAGTGAYLLRRKLGLTAYTPPQDSGRH